MAMTLFRSAPRHAGRAHRAAVRSTLRAWALALAAAAAAAPLALAPAPAAAAQVQHEGVAFDTTARVGPATLQLNGMGLRGVAWIRAFVAGLYVRQPARDAQQLLADAGPKRLTLKILLDAPAAELGKAVRRGVRKNVAEPQLAAMAERLERLAVRIDQIGRVRPGDALDLDYLPGSGMVLRVNGQARGAPIAGADLYRAVLAIFIGDKPVDPEMKQGLLAGGVGGSQRRGQGDRDAQAAAQPARASAGASANAAPRSAQGAGVMAQAGGAQPASAAQPSTPQPGAASSAVGAAGVGSAEGARPASGAAPGPAASPAP
jgi:hypothetical protein